MEVYESEDIKTFEMEVIRTEPETVTIKKGLQMLSKH